MKSGAVAAAKAPELPKTENSVLLQYEKFKNLFLADVAMTISKDLEEMAL